jgi:hypothetical protein
VDAVETRIPSIRGRPALQELIANLKPGITVSLVSLPLSISLAIAADATPVQGIITAAWAGLVSAMFGGSHYNIVGPTGTCDWLQRLQGVAGCRYDRQTRGALAAPVAVLAEPPAPGIAVRTAQWMRWHGMRRGGTGSLARYVGAALRRGQPCPCDRASCPERATCCGAAAWELGGGCKGGRAASGRTTRNCAYLARTYTSVDHYCQHEPF